MKKQILFLVLLVIAVFANVTMSYGQGAVAGSAPEALGSGCTDDALHPIAGKPYVYQVAASPASGTYLWWATKDPNFITSTIVTPTVTTTKNNSVANVLTIANGGLMSVTTSSYNNVANLTDQISLVWSSATLANTVYKTNPTFVAVYYTPPAGSGCADNIKVYEIDPRNAFTVDIKNLDYSTMATMAYGETESQCVANVTSAKYNNGAHTMDYLYGTNYQYYEVVAANFTGEWKPTFKFTGLTGNLDQATTAEWSYTKTFPAGTTYPIDLATGATASVTTNETDTHLGVSIYVRLTIQNNHFETTPGAQTVTVAVDGKNAAGELDIVNSTCAIQTVPDFVDIATQVIDPRPNVTGVTTGTGSTPVNDTLIPKLP